VLEKVLITIYIIEVGVCVKNQERCDDTELCDVVITINQTV
jgi:hypothetical protein